MDDIIILDQHGRTALHREIQSKSSNRVEQLLANEALDTNYTRKVTNEDKYTVLHMVAIHWPAIPMDLFRRILDRCTIETINAQDHRGQTALHLAISHSITTSITEERVDNHAVTHALLQHPKLDVNIEDNEGQMPIHVAVQKESFPGLLKIIEVLLNRMNKDGVNVNQQDKKGYAALHWAIHVRSLEKIELLLEKGANVNQRIDNRLGSTPLQLAVQEWTDPNNIKKVFTLLLKARNFDIQVPDKRGNTALQTAENKNSATKQLLLDTLAEVQHDIANEH